MDGALSRRCDHDAGRAARRWRDSVAFSSRSGAQWPFQPISYSIARQSGRAQVWRLVTYAFVHSPSTRCSGSRSRCTCCSCSAEKWNASSGAALILHFIFLACRPGGGACDLGTLAAFSLSLLPVHRRCTLEFSLLSLLSIRDAELFLRIMAKWVVIDSWRRLHISTPRISRLERPDSRLDKHWGSVPFH